MTLPNSTSAPSPISLTRRPPCEATHGSKTRLRLALSLSSVPASSISIRWLKSATSAERIAASLRCMNTQVLWVWRSGSTGGSGKPPVTISFRDNPAFSFATPDSMGTRHLPARDKLTICFAHVAYRMGERFALRDAGLDWFEVRGFEDLKARIAEVDVLLCSGLWRNELIPLAPRLAFIQSISAGTDQYSRDALVAAGIRTASAQGVNERAVAEHAMALILAVTRQIPQARDNQ